eukprot:3688803-Amphidinium_carterae.1
MAKVHGPENPADLMTKLLNADMMYKHLKKLGLRVRKEQRDRQYFVARLDRKDSTLSPGPALQLRSALSEVTTALEWSSTRRWSVSPAQPYCPKGAVEVRVVCVRGVGYLLHLLVCEAQCFDQER